MFTFTTFTGIIEVGGDITKQLCNGNQSASTDSMESEGEKTEGPLCQNLENLVLFFAY